MTPNHGDQLIDLLTSYGSVVVTLSGGVDSSVVAAAAHAALGDRALALTARSPAVSEADLTAAADVINSVGIRHVVVDTDELAVNGYRANGPRRCYFCKSVLLDTARDYADRNGFAEVATGTNADDRDHDYRPGIAAGTERGVRTPLADLNLNKPTIRDIAEAWNLPTTHRPASACLSSRVAYGIAISPERLRRIGEAERQIRRKLTSTTNVRVRDLGDKVRVETDANLVPMLQRDPEIGAILLQTGFDVRFEVTVFKSGSLNELLTRDL